MMREDAKSGYFQTITIDSKPYSVQCASGTMAYLDAPAGEYDCWSPNAAAGEHFRWCYLPMPDPASPPTLSTAAFPEPTAAASGQTAGVPTGAVGAGMAPANAAPIRLHVAPGYRLVILYSATGPVKLFCNKVM